MAQQINDSPEAIIAELRNALRQLKVTGHAEVSAFSSGLLIPPANGVWQDDPDVYVDVFIRNGGLKVEAGATIQSVGQMVTYGWRLFSTTTSSGNVYETFYGGPYPGGQVESWGAYVGATRSKRINGLPTGTYRVRGGYAANAGATTMNIWNRSLIAIPR